MRRSDSQKLDRVPVFRLHTVVFWIKATQENKMVIQLIEQRCSQNSVYIRYTAIRCTTILLQVPDLCHNYTFKTLNRS